MGKCLDQAGWAAITPPFVWVKLKAIITDDEQKIISNWLTLRTSGWWHVSHDGESHHTYVFERNDDMIMFRLWISDDPFREDNGELT